MAIDTSASTAYTSNRYALRGVQTFAQRASAKQLTTAESLVRQTKESDNALATYGVARLVAGNDKITQVDADAFLASLMTPDQAVAALMSRPYSGDTITVLIVQRDRSRKALQAMRRTQAPTAQAPASDAAPVPEGYYALEYKGTLMFYRVKHGKGQWEGRTFVNRFRSDDMLRITRVESDAALQNLRTPELQESARATFARETVCCYMCAKRLTDDTSRSLGIGPHCRNKG